VPIATKTLYAATGVRIRATNCRNWSADCDPRQGRAVGCCRYRHGRRSQARSRARGSTYPRRPYHDAFRQPIAVTNAGGTTMSPTPARTENFLGVLDLESTKGKVAKRATAASVFREYETGSAEAGAIQKMARAACRRLAEEDRRPPIAMLYRRGSFSWHSGSIDCRTRCESEIEAEIALSPGFRWGSPCCRAST